mgnify:CR=1 FL=1
MNSSVTSYVASGVVSTSVDDINNTLGQLEFSTESLPGLAPPRCSDKEYKQLLLYREKLRAQHLKMEADRQAMRRKILMKYGIKENERHKSALSSKLSGDEQALLVKDDENNDGNHQKESESCLSCIICCCFKRR